MGAAFEVVVQHPADGRLQKLVKAGTVVSFDEHRIQPQLVVPHDIAADAQLREHGQRAPQRGMQAR